MTTDSLSYEQEREIERLLATANLQRMRGQWVEAEETCRKVLAISPNDVAVREMLADILHECGKLDMALSEYRTAMDLAPGKPSLETKYAKVTLDIADREREKALAQDMLENPRKYTTREKSPIMALMWAVIPGLGQFYNGDMVKAGVIWGTLLVFILSWVTLQQPYPRNVDSLQLFIIATNPFVLSFGVLFLLAYIYSMIDAPIVADKSSKASKNKLA